jgi:hypothetical protein
MKVIIRVDFEPDPQPPTLAIVPNPKFKATVKLVSRYEIGHDGEVKKIA